ncbi:hypothetical protein, partial [Pseudomonas oryzihabitans]|uniref:hypothetical protein n=1 Tax=Pseudomonas oryzihabitans TaxID=47885 RepID=UPI00286B57E1
LTGVLSLGREKFGLIRSGVRLSTDQLDVHRRHQPARISDPLHFFEFFRYTMRNSLGLIGRGAERRTPFFLLD